MLLRARCLDSDGNVCCDLDTGGLGGGWPLVHMPLLLFFHRRKLHHEGLALPRAQVIAHHLAVPALLAAERRVPSVVRNQNTSRISKSIRSGSENLKEHTGARQTDLYMKMSQSPASRLPQREQASMAQRQVAPHSSGSISKNEEEEDVILFRVGAEP